MTLVIAGFEKVKDGWGKVWGKHDPGTMSLRTEGLFVVADSVITATGSAGQRPILSGLRKAHFIPIKLWKPYFVDRYFRNYSEVFMESGCFVAFSGSTLTATHALNGIVEHLGKLQISYVRSKVGGPGKYIVQRSCEFNLLRDEPGTTLWNEDMFLPNDFFGLLTSEYIAGCGCQLKVPI